MKRCLCFVLLIVFIIGFSYAKPKATIRGRVSDQQGKPLAEIKVEVTDTLIATKTIYLRSGRPSTRETHSTIYSP